MCDDFVCLRDDDVKTARETTSKYACTSLALHQRTKPVCMVLIKFDLHRRVPASMASCSCYDLASTNQPTARDEAAGARQKGQTHQINMDYYHSGETMAITHDLAVTGDNSTRERNISTKKTSIHSASRAHVSHPAAAQACRPSSAPKLSSDLFLGVKRTVKQRRKPEVHR